MAHGNQAAKKDKQAGCPKQIKSSDDANPKCKACDGNAHKAIEQKRPPCQWKNFVAIRPGTVPRVHEKCVTNNLEPLLANCAACTRKMCHAKLVTITGYRSIGDQTATGHRSTGDKTEAFQWKTRRSMYIRAGPCGMLDT